MKTSVNEAKKISFDINGSFPRWFAVDFSLKTKEKMNKEMIVIDAL